MPAYSLRLAPSLYRVFSAFRCELSRFNYENQQHIKALGLTPQQFSLLLVLGAAGGEGLSVGEAAERLHIAHNSVVELSQRAEAAGLLTRISQGGRRQGTLLLLTQHGADRLDEITARLITELAEERERLIETLSRWNMVLAARGLTPPTAAPQAELRQMGQHEKSLIWKLLQLYLDELSLSRGSVPGEDGEYDYPTFDHYWEKQGYAVYLLQVEQRPAGFALVRQLQDLPAWHALDEFCVLRAYRGQGLGAFLAGEVLHARPGRWSVAHLRQNRYACHFWDQVLPRHAAQPPTYREDPALPGLWHFEFETKAEAALSAD
ncbi:GNAT family N-acetyltransferase [Deinococcus humi]|uniref:Putative acetyltransferase/DNA-binding MarR family transcriptional regulator n=1 Tax=Deinococcus humi TaxID=662880 RepID=A0A7W8JV85_9DEIO|nr:GNAT family N-acetyltransferase [Deinococcus humi]MBB5363443.1 putative acetyltransferase/DNA-binding MarR family transcriptional regulator [Deinococcus humi]GGO26488.1 hypothetical protein GCM10008949_17300 [Deinococcus humi]